MVNKFSAKITKRINCNKLGTQLNPSIVEKTTKNNQEMQNV